MQGPTPHPTRRSSGCCHPCGFHCRRAQQPPRPAAVFAGPPDRFHQHSFKVAGGAQGPMETCVLPRGHAWAPGTQPLPSDQEIPSHLYSGGPRPSPQPHSPVALSTAPLSCIPVTGGRQAASFREPQRPRRFLSKCETASWPDSSAGRKKRGNLWLSSLLFGHPSKMEDPLLGTAG